MSRRKSLTSSGTRARRAIASTGGPADIVGLNREISARYPTLSKRLRQIAEFALKHPNEIAIESIAVIAQHAGVQPSALIRFAKELGLEGIYVLTRILQMRQREC